MTATLNQGSQTLSRLILSCRLVQNGFQSAAENIENDELKRLFGIYAQQRHRFANELSGLAAGQCGDDGSGPRAAGARQIDCPPDILAHCLATEQNALALYRSALQERTLSRQARFLVSSQLTLLEQVHSRIQSLGLCLAPKS